MTETTHPPDEPALAPGMTVLGRYHVDEFLSHGGMGEVYRGHHELLEYPVALKVIRAGAADSLRKRFLREASLMARVRHPNVVAVLDFGILDAGWPCLAMEFVEGEELRHRLRDRGPMSWDEALRVFRAILSGLVGVHAASVLHRDLKPSNIVLSSGPPEVVKLIDFGIALGTDAADGTRYTESGMAVGTPEFMAPEQLLCEAVDERTDLYSATLVLYNMLCGASPFSGEGLTSAIKRFTEAIPPPRSPDQFAEVPAGLQQLVQNNLAPLPEDRTQSAEQYLAAIDAILRDPASVQNDGVAHSGSSAAPVDRGQATVDEATAAIRPPHLTGPQESGGVVATRVKPVRIPPAEDPLDTVSSATPREEIARALVGARLPAVKLKSKDERVWLASVVRDHGRAYSIGGQFWLTLLGTPSEAQRDEQVSQLVDSLRARYGSRTAIAWCPVDGSFRLTTASLTGATPLPVECQELIRELTGRPKR